MNTPSNTIEHRVIKILVDTLKRYADGANWNKTLTNDFDQFGSKGDGFTIAQEALDEVYRVIEEENKKKVYLPSGTIFPIGSTLGGSPGGNTAISSQYTFRTIPNTSSMGGSVSSGGSSNAL